MGMIWSAIREFWWIFLLLTVILILTVTYQRGRRQAEKSRAQALTAQTKATIGMTVILDSGMHGIIREIREHSYLIEIAPTVLVEFEKYGVIFHNNINIPGKTSSSQEG